MLTRCLVVHADGTTEAVVWNQCEIAARLGGSVTFVGTVDALDVVMVALAENASLARHVWNDSNLLFEDAGVVRGPIVCIGTSAVDGEPVDVDVEALEAWWRGGGR